ncbi:hypothetical protein C1H46_036129 [Malus baccata]|uniref:Translation elongation factor P/YeiP central domain-containing protein n=1 Tax=Malus baccata TaxID=106549 RepID=A0A540KVS1_MALBA|nr:hypothetical protein C1H46_036129 [Malus baccata]
MHNYASGNTVEKTFRAGSTSTYEETRVNELSIGDKTKWLKEGMDCNLLLWNDKLIDVDIPITVQLKVFDVDPGLKGDTAQVHVLFGDMKTGKIPPDRNAITGLGREDELINQLFVPTVCLVYLSGFRNF